MNAVVAADVPRGNDSFGGLVKDGETPEQALRRLEKSAKYSKVIGSDDGQRLLAAATLEVRGGGIARAVHERRVAAEALETETPPARGRSILDIPLASIDVGTNVRVNVAELDELASSIQVRGVLQPIKVRRSGDRYTIVWGQRRFLASQMVGLETIPAIVVDDEPPAATLAIEQLVENLHRADLPPLDRARAMRQVVDAGVSQADLARELGIHTSTISNDLGLLEAPPAIRKAIEAGELTPSHAKALKGFAPKTQQELARDAIANGWSAHRLEEQVQRRKEIAEREAQQQRANEEQSKKDIERLQASIDELATKKQPGLDAEIVVFQDYYGQGDIKAKALAESLSKAGFKNVRLSARGDIVAARPKSCDCTAWKATLHSSYSYQSNGYVTKLSVTKACIVAKHRRAAEEASYAAERGKSALQERVCSHVKATAATRVVEGGIAVDRILAEAILWDSLSYQLPEWAVARGGKRNQPWAVLHALTDEELAAELQKRIAGDFRDKAGYHVDWTALAAELGVDQVGAAAPAEEE